MQFCQTFTSFFFFFYNICIFFRKMSYRLLFLKRILNKYNRSVASKHNLFYYFFDRLSSRNRASLFLYVYRSGFQTLCKTHVIINVAGVQKLFCNRIWKQYQYVFSIIVSYCESDVLKKSFRRTATEK